MNLRSKFKDYYDYLIHIYGKDDLIFFNRDIASKDFSEKPYIFNGTENDRYNAERKSFKFNTDIFHEYDFTYGTYSYVYKKNNITYSLLNRDESISVFTLFISIGGRVFTLAKFEDASKSFLCRSVIKKYHVLVNGELLSEDKSPLNFKLLNDTYIEGLNEIHKSLDTPIFVFDIYRDTISVFNYVPILNDLGFPSIVEPTQMYQRLQCYIGQVLNSSKNEPPVQISNNNLIVSKGFDLKTSFRKRKHNDHSSS
jgi:hypothetical protein